MKWIQKIINNSKNNKSDNDGRPECNTFEKMPQCKVVKLNKYLKMKEAVKDRNYWVNTNTAKMTGIEKFLLIL